MKSFFPFGAKLPQKPIYNSFYIPANQPPDDPFYNSFFVPAQLTQEQKERFYKYRTVSRPVFNWTA